MINQFNLQERPRGPFPKAGAWTVAAMLWLLWITGVPSSLALDRANPVGPLWSDSLPGRKVFQLELLEEVAAPFWRKVQLGFDEAEAAKADLILVRLNTYGGQVDYADSVRTRLLKSQIPVVVWIDNNAASAGALIALSALRIYMAPSASMGAATVVNQQGEAVPDKYQSYMRATMRATAEARGRNARLAECMVDPGLGYPGVLDSGKVLTLTSSEALKLGFSDGTASSEEEVLALAGLRQPVLIRQNLDFKDKIIQFLLNPAVSGILILLMLGGLYLELQSPGIGLPLLVAGAAAALYFAPLYLEGLATNWEILLFVVGLVLLALEIWVLPGFGWVGALGLGIVFLALVGSMLDNEGLSLPQEGGNAGGSRLVGAVLAVLIPLLGLGLAFLLWGERLFSQGPLRHLVLRNPEPNQSETESNRWKGLQGIAHTRLNPVGKIRLEGSLMEAQSEEGWIEEGSSVEVLRREQNRLYVRKI